MTKINAIASMVASEHNIPVSDMTGNMRTKRAAWPRQEAMMLLREFTSYSLTEIGKFFGGRDHTTIMHAIRAVNAREQKFEEVRERMDKLRDLIECEGKARFYRHSGHETWRDK